MTRGQTGELPFSPPDVAARSAARRAGASSDGEGASSDGEGASSDGEGSSSPVPLGNILAGLPPASAELLAQRELLRRSDTKFLVPDRLVEPLVMRLSGDYLAVVGEAGAACSYRTRYFDTPDLQSFHDHRRGRRLRQKVRVREYRERASTYLEVKARRSAVLTFKRRMPRPSGAAPLSEAEREFVAGHASYPAWALAPVARIDYRRATLLSARGPERVTIDVDLAVGADGATRPLAGLAIVEVKQRSFSVATPAMRALRDLKLRWRSVSKYCTAVALTREGVRCNRFLPALREIERMMTCRRS